MFEIIFARPLTIYNTTEPINSALFSRAKPLRSPRLVKFNLFNFYRKRCNMIERFSRPFSLWHLLEKWFVLSVFSKDGFLSFTFFPSDSQLCVAGFLIRQLFYSDLLNMEMIITNSVLSASLLIYYIISFPARSRRIIIIKYSNLVELPEPTEINAIHIYLKCLKSRK